MYQAPEKGECVRQTEGRILWVLHIMKWALDPTLHFWVSRKYHVKTTWLAWKFSVVPTWESGERPGCLAWAHNDCQGTSCCCLKNIRCSSNSIYNEASRPILNEDKYGLLCNQIKIFKLLKIYMRKQKLHENTAFSKWYLSALVTERRNVANWK